MTPLALPSRIDARNAAFGIVPDSLDGAVITNDFWSFEIDRDQVDLDYFYLLSQTDAFLDACVRSSTGTTNRQRIQDLAQHRRIHLPALQRREGRGQTRTQLLVRFHGDRHLIEVGVHDGSR